MKEKQINDFDAKALTWDDNPLNIERAAAIADHIKMKISIQPEMTGFEYGCGTGLLSLNLLPYLKTITAADSSEGMLNILKQKTLKHQIKNLRVLKTDLINEDILHEKFDLVYTAMTMHHINDLHSIFGKFYTMLNNNGFLVIADLDKEDGSFHGKGFSGHNGFDREELKWVFSKSGFKNVQCETCYQINRKNEKGIMETYPVFLMIGQK